MGGGRVPGPVCSFRNGDEWIDLGTMCRTRTEEPGAIDLMWNAARIIARRTSSFKAKFDQEHIYSTAPESARKRDIDLQIIDDNYARSAEISLDNEGYLKKLIEIASGGKKKVLSGTKQLQFFIVHGGAEGLLPREFLRVNATDIISPGSTTHDEKKDFVYQFTWDMNDLIAVFDRQGKLIRAAQLKRPTSILDMTMPAEDPKQMFRASTASKIYGAWDNKPVVIYKNTGFEVPYLGLHVEDGGPWIVDLHKEEDTNGCIFIADPPPPDKEALKTFEPKLILDVLRAVGKDVAKVNRPFQVGMMQLVDI